MSSKVVGSLEALGTLLALELPFVTMALAHVRAGSASTG